MDPLLGKAAPAAQHLIAQLLADRTIAFLALFLALCLVTPAGAADSGTIGGFVSPCSGPYRSDCNCCPPCDPSTPYYVSPAVPRQDATRVWPDGQEPTYRPPTGTPEAAADAIGEFDTGDATSNLPSGLGAVAASASPSVHMIGDFFGSGYFLGAADGFATVPGAGGDRRFKATDNLNPFPQNRVFFNYHHFHNAVSDVAGENRNVDRFTFGLERTFFDDMMSFEVRVPFDSGLDSAQDISMTDTVTSEFGNVSLTVKALLWERRCWKITSGLATILPTAGDASVEGDGTLSVLENNAVHLQPFLGVKYSNECSRFFSTAYVAFDVDTNGNALSSTFGSGSSAPFLQSLGDVRDQTLLFIDWQIGRWCYFDYGHIGYLNAVAPVLELHYTKAIEAPENFSVYQNPFGKPELLNLTAGLVFDFRNTVTLTVYGAAPLKRDEAVLFGRSVSPVFQSEFGVQCVYRY